MTVSELLERISARELIEWRVFYEMEPWGCEAGFMGHAITAATVANANRGKGQRAKEVKDFMPQFGPKTQKSPEELYDMIKQNLLSTQRRKPENRRTP